MLALIVALTLGAALGQQQERVAEIRIQGNYRTPEAEIRTIAAVQVGDPLTPESIDAIRKRLHDSGRFDQVEIRKRWRTLDATDEVVLVILVEERPSGVSGAVGHVTRALGRPQILPILDYEDGYGFIYGARLSPPKLLGEQSHVSVPLSWGGTRQAAVEINRQFTRGPITVVSGAGGIKQRENPFYDIDDRRTSISGRLERSFGKYVRTGGGASWSDVSFGTINDELVTWGADIAFDTRSDPELPRNAVYFQAGWERLDFDSGSADRYKLDGRGYVGLFGSSILALRAQRMDASAPLPPYEQFLLGGASSLRGFPAGYAVGDTFVGGSAEFRVPLTSVLSFGSAGALAFVDTATVYSDGTSIGDATWETGVGGGVYAAVAFLKLNLDVGYGIDRGWRAHFSTGFQF